MGAGSQQARVGAAFRRRCLGVRPTAPLPRGEEPSGPECGRAAGKREPTAEQREAGRRVAAPSLRLARQCEGERARILPRSGYGTRGRVCASGGSGEVPGPGLEVDESWCRAPAAAAGWHMECQGSPRVPGLVCPWRASAPARQQSGTGGGTELEGSWWNCIQAATANNFPIRPDQEQWQEAAQGCDTARELQ